MNKKVGYKSPPMDKRFGQPNGNPIGKTSEQKALEIANAEAATRLHGKMLAALERQLESATDAATIESITANILKLTKDAQDRGLGAPVQLVDNTSSDGSMTPKPAIDAKKLSDGAMAEILNASPDEG